jgi:IS605 OrfB family transposase
MHLVEQHIIERRDPRFAHIDEAAFESKNLYNAALYELRQAFIFEELYIPYEEMDKRMQRHEAYRKLPAKVAQKVLDQLDKMWQSYFEACKEYREHPEKFLGHPRLPKYKHKTEGRNLLVYTIQAISRGKKGLKRGSIKPSMLPITVKTKQDPATIDQVRIVPRKGCYVVEVVYEKAVVQADVNPAWYAGIDLGINNLAAVASNKPGFQPVVVNGRPVKSINQFYNKRMAELQKKLGHTGTTRRMGRITTKRNRRIDHYMHAASKRIVDLLVEERIGAVIIGKNDGWKQACEMGTQNNQNFVQIPHARFIAMLTYKAELVGITVKLTEESYTSQASFLDRDEMPVYDPNRTEEPAFSGKRLKKPRGLYRASGKRNVNADINGAYNIIRKVAPKAFAEDAEDFVVHPVRMTLAK